MESGENGVIEIERADKPGMETEHTDGMRINEGWRRHEFINDPANLAFLIEDCAVVVTDREITAIEELKWLEMLGIKGKKRVVIICDECNGDALATFVKCARVGSFRCCVVKAPGVGARKGEILKDIACMTGATLISEETGYNLHQITMNHIGHARQINVGQHKTTILADVTHMAVVGDKSVSVGDLVKGRLAEIEAQIEHTDPGYDLDKLKERRASLTDGVSVIKLGGATENERILTKRKIEDAVHAVQCAKEGGIVAGGGTALLKCAGIINGLILDEQLEDADERKGAEIIKEAIESPAKRILEVAAVEPEPAPWYYRIHPTIRDMWAKKCQNKIIEHVKALASNTEGYDMSQLDGYNFKDLVEGGVVDPVKVVRTAFKNGASCGKTFVSEECAITPIRETDPVYTGRR